MRIFAIQAYLPHILFLNSVASIVGLSLANAQPVVTVGPNIRASDNLAVPFVENSISADPANPNNILITSSVADTGNTTYPNGALETCVLTSLDGGQTWKRSLSTGFTNAAVTWGPDQTAYFTTITSSSPTLLYRSTNFGVNWTNYSQITGPADSPTIACDTVSSLYSGRLYSSGGGNGFNIFTSTNGGANFTQSTEAAMAPNTFDFPSQWAFYPDGTAMLSLEMDQEALNVGPYFDTGEAVRVSTDGGQTFSAETPVLDTAVMQYSPPLPGTVVPTGGTFAIDACIGVAPDGSRVYFARSDQKTVGKYRILFASSDNKGGTATAPVMLAPDSGNTAQYNPRLAVNKYGTVGVIWFDTRQTTDLSAYDLYFSYSVDKGQTFSTPQRITTASSTPKFSYMYSSDPTVDATYRWLPGFDDLRFVTGGDHIGLTADSNGNFLAAWPDGRALFGGIQQTMFSRIQVAPNAVVSAVSRFISGANNLDLPLAVSGTPTVEPRRGPVSGAYQIVLTFSGAVGPAVAVLQRASGTSPLTGSVSSQSASGSVLTVNLAGVGDDQRLNLQISGVSGVGTVNFPINFLAGDVDGNGVVSAADLTPLKAAYGSSFGGAGFNPRADTNADGVVSAADLSQVKAGYGNSLP